jgi:hypothetical protein
VESRGSSDDPNRGFFEALVGDGRPLLSLSGLILLFAGGFALFLSATGHFLPHDVQFLGMTSVFVPQDLAYLGLKVSDLEAVNKRLVPLIAHDRAGFGGGIFTCGWLVLGCVWCGTPSRSLWQALAIAGGMGFACALGVHFMVGYTDWLHLTPAAAGAGLHLTGLVLTKRSMTTPSVALC